MYLFFDMGIWLAVTFLDGFCHKLPRSSCFFLGNIPRGPLAYPVTLALVSFVMVHWSFIFLHRQCVSDFMTDKTKRDVFLGKFDVIASTPSPKSHTPRNIRERKIKRQLEVPTKFFDYLGSFFGCWINDIVLFLMPKSFINVMLNR